MPEVRQPQLDGCSNLCGIWEGRLCLLTDGMNGQSSKKLHEKTQRQVREAEERISAQQEEMAVGLGGQHDSAHPRVT